MNKRKFSATAKAFAGIAGFVTAVSMLFVGFVPATAEAQTASELQATINALLAQIQALQLQLNTQSGGTSSSAVCPYTWTRSLTMGSTGDDVMKLQMFLNSDSGTILAASGAGSPGNETSYFGAITKAGVTRFQNQYASEVLTPLGLAAGTGYFGASSRAKANALCASAPVNPPTNPPTTPNAGSGLTVSGTTQPANSLAPQNAARVPFTRFTLTASVDGAITVNGVTIERVGLGTDAAFSGIVLLDENGTQLGVSKTLNSNHQAIVGGTFTVPAGTTRTYTVAGNMNSSLGSYAGEVPALSVVAINTSATVVGSLPITGASHTINSTLTIGTATVSVSSLDPNTSATKEIGTTGYRFAGIRIQAGSSEKIRLHSIRWNQTGSVSEGDLANLVMVVNNVEYPMTVSSDAKYYSAMIPGGLVIDKGFSVDAYVKGDIVGGNAAGRTIVFDIDKNTDIAVTGELYTYGIIPAASGPATAVTTSSQFTTGTPFFDNAHVTVSAGSASTISKATSVAAQNIAVNVPNQPLGGFEINIKGEPISVQSLAFTVATSSTGTGLLTNVSIVDENGSVVAGPVDATGAGTTLTFSSSVTFPLGNHTYTLQGQLPSGYTNNGTITLSTNPSTQWTTVRGETSGNTITLSQGNFSMNTMTVKAASLAVNVSSSPSAQNVVAGSQDFLFATYQFDTTQSGEDVRFSGLTADYDTGTSATAAAPSMLSGCQIFDGATPLNTSSIPDMSLLSASTTGGYAGGVDVAFTFDNQLTVPKGVVKELGLKCDVSSSAHSASQFQFGISSANITAVNATGVTSSNSITETGNASGGQIMTVTAGSLVVSQDSLSPSYTVVSAGSTANLLGVYKFRATNEAVNLTRVGLKLTNTASSSASDLAQVQLRTGSAAGPVVGTATFTGSNTNATSTLSSPLNLPKDTDVKIYVTGTLSGIGTSLPGTQGHLLAIDVDTNGTNTQGTGVGSGTTINATGSTAVSGVRLFKSFPMIVKDTVPTNTLGNGTKALLRFKVKADAQGDVGIYKFTARIATTTATVSNVNLYAFTDSSYNTAVSGLSADGGLLVTDLTGTDLASSATDLEFFAQTSLGASTTVQVPADGYRYFEIRGTVAGSASGASVQTTLQGDAGYPSLAASTFMGTTLTINNDSNDNIIWSPNATTTSSVDANDWTNGYGVNNLGSGNLTPETLSQ